MRFEIEIKTNYSERNLEEIIQQFKTGGNVIDDDRNVIKYFNYQDSCLNIKFFKRINFINRFVYRFFRQSKAKRSFLYAQNLIKLGIGTPAPVAFLDRCSTFKLKESYYISEQITFDYEFRDLLKRKISDMEDVLIAFTRFTYKMHESGVYFIDHSPGNTLIKENDNGYEFYLVDLNRMKFHNQELSLDLGIKNFYRLGSTPEMVEVMAKEYARLRDVDEKYVLSNMMKQTMLHNLAVAKKRARRNK